jgi:GNAT superfamily N-acetyltransferase
VSSVEVTTWYLEMRSLSELRRVDPPGDGVCFSQAKIPSPELNRFLYTAVGGQWYWIDRLAWDFRRWQEWLERDELETWLLLVQGTPAGYVELEMQPGDNVEVAYFGLLPRFLGQGLGGYLLSASVERAWARGASRVWVHTCSLDGPNALPNYQARGFRIYDQQTHHADLPERPTGPWPGAGL